MSSRISVVINTLNEEARLPYALRSVSSWVDEIVVVDMHSSDRTVEVARGFGAAVYVYPPMGFVEPARAFAISKASGDWVLLLDADELISPKLAVKLRAIASEGAADAVWLPRLNYLFGSRLRATGWGPRQDRQLRFFKPGLVQVTGTIHDFIRATRAAHVLTIPYQTGVALVHFNYTSARHFIEKSNRYTSIEADQAFADGQTTNIARLLWAPVREFLRLYVWRFGYRDGWRGLHLSILMAFYRFAAQAKLRERILAGTEAEIVANYRAVSEQWLSNSAATPDS